MEVLKQIIKEIDNYLSQNTFELEDKDITFIRSFNEVWFSNTLAWLLDPHGSHGFGVKFINEFVKTIGKIRSSSNYDYARKATMLKHGKEGKGIVATHFSLKNISIIREFYLAKSINRKIHRGPRYCDLALIDLDPTDGLFVIVENKLFSSNHPGQLEEYYNLVNKNFSKARIREYVYLTLNGIEPICFEPKSKQVLRNWIQMSWTTDILDILKKLSDGNEHKEVKRFKKLLEWLKNLSNSNIKTSIEDLRKLLLKATAICLEEELNRLGEGQPGTWSITEKDNKSITLYHSSYPKTPLFLELLPNLSVTAQSRRRGKPLYEKIIVPYGANTDQIYNLLDMAALDIYHNHFNNNSGLYKADKRKLRKTISPKKIEMRSILQFFSRNHFELKILFLMSNHVWEAQKEDFQDLE